MAEPFTVRVAVDAPQHAGLSAPLDYVCERPLTPGTLVQVPLGRRVVAGIVWGGEASGAAPAELRPVDQALDALPALNEAWRALVDFAAAYYQRSTGEIALSVLPPELRKLGNTQLANRIAKLRRALAAGAAAGDTPAATGAPPHSTEQAEALGRIAVLAQAAPAATVLVHGVTGSGKTEVYLGAAATALAAGRQALVLVPEINLTPQLEARFAARFAGRHIVS